MPSSDHDVIIIGAGWSGLIAAKYALEEGLRPLVLERREVLGGVWRFTADPSVATVMRSTCTSSSRCVTEMSDLPLPKDRGEFPHHSTVAVYLDAYADRFGLRDHIRFGTKVVECTKREDRWITRTEDGAEFSARNLIVCSGLHTRPNPGLDHLSGFTGQRRHAMQVKSITPELRSQRVLVVGGGETAADVVVELCRAGAKGVTWSIPNGQQFFRKHAAVTHLGWLLSLGKKKSNRIVLDEAGSLAIRSVVNFRGGKQGMAWLCNLSTSGSPTRFNGHGIEAWRTKAGVWRSFYNKCGHVLDHVYDGDVVPKSACTDATGDAVSFADGTTETFDQIIECTGYTPAFPFLPKRNQVCMSKRYKLVMDPDDPSLLFMGFARPIIGSIPLVTELQAMAFLRMVAGRTPRPSTAAMRAQISEDNASYDEQFRDTSRRVRTLVDPFVYTSALGRLAGRVPELRDMMKADPLAALTVFFAPFNSAFFRLVDDDNDASIQRMRGYLTPTWLMAPVVFGVSRAVGVRWVFEALARSPARGLGHRLGELYRRRVLDHDRPFGARYEHSARYGEAL